MNDDHMVFCKPSVAVGMSDDFTEAYVNAVKLVYFVRCIAAGIETTSTAELE